MLQLILQFGFLPETYDCDTNFNKFMEFFSKTYQNFAETSQAHDNFCENLAQLLDTTNDSCINCTITSVYDLDLKTIFKPIKIPQMNVINPASSETPQSSETKQAIAEDCATQGCATKNPLKTLTTLPLSIDHRELGLTTMAAAQGSCGVCWSFSATYMLENLILRDYGKIESKVFQLNANELNLSVQYILRNGFMRTQFCEGSVATSVLNYIDSVSPLRTLEFSHNLPYNIQQYQKDAFSKKIPVAPSAEVLSDPYIPWKKIPLSTQEIQQPTTNVISLMSGESNWEFNQQNVQSQLARGIAVMAMMYVSASSTTSKQFSSYDGTGVLPYSACSQLNYDHAVTFIGYGRKNGVNVWIVKNSWGETWGNHGSFYIQRGTNSHCIEKFAFSMIPKHYEDSDGAFDQSNPLPTPYEIFRGDDGLDCDTQHPCPSTVCKSTTCSSKGAICQIVNGKADCSHCRPGYTGSTCSQCTSDYYKLSQLCEPKITCNNTEQCASNQQCIIIGNRMACQCYSYAGGSTCIYCSKGYHLNESKLCVKDETCDTTSCNEHGTCDDSTKSIVCKCDTGYNGTLCATCNEGYVMTGKECIERSICYLGACPNHSYCSEIGTTAKCTCETGYFGDSCAQCAFGYHYNSSTSLCVVNTKCEYFSCNLQQNCDDSLGYPVCTCLPHQTGDDCTDCMFGYHNEDSLCVKDRKCQEDSCNSHQYCSDYQGFPFCNCKSGYYGENCSLCMKYFSMNTDKDCINQKCQSLQCNDNQLCIANSATVSTCRCKLGYGGTKCSSCFSSYHLEGSRCVINEKCIDGACDSLTQDCTVISGIATCSCKTGFQSDGTGKCISSGCTSSSCNSHQNCDASSGAPVCSCKTGYSGSDCSSCTDGYHLSGSDCIVNTNCLSDSCNSHQNCDASSGAPVCSCKTGYSGSDCQVCASNYHIENSICIKNEECDASSCNNNQNCIVISEVTYCHCKIGYDGNDCSFCTTGYHMRNGACEVDSGCDIAQCNSHQSCDDLLKYPVCNCLEHFIGEECQSCESGYHLSNDGNSCVINTVCSDIFCTSRQNCVEIDSVAHCICKTGLTGTNCNVCEDSTKVLKDDMCITKEICTVSSCSNEMQCDDSTGIITCSCTDDYQLFNQLCLPKNSCVFNTQLCNSHQNCSINKEANTAQCVCNIGYSGSDCSICSENYQKVDEQCITLNSCLLNQEFCGQFGQCLENGTCQCSIGYADKQCSTCAQGYYQKYKKCWLDGTEAIDDESQKSGKKSMVKYIIIGCSATLVFALITAWLISYAIEKKKENEAILQSNKIFHTTQQKSLKQVDVVVDEQDRYREISCVVQKEGSELVE